MCVCVGAESGGKLMMIELLALPLTTHFSSTHSPVCFWCPYCWYHPLVFTLWPPPYVCVLSLRQRDLYDTAIWPMHTNSTNARRQFFTIFLLGFKRWHFTYLVWGRKSALKLVVQGVIIDSHGGQVLFWICEAFCPSLVAMVTRRHIMNTELLRCLIYVGESRMQSLQFYRRFFYSI